jgi:predicted esterase YcpF (UPF0227 family)
MILFIHGFRSCGLGVKSEALRDYFGADQVLTPDLPHDPAQAIDLLERLIAQHPVDLLVGSSLGGYYATWLNRGHTYPAVLVNPAVAPYALLDDYLGEHEDCHGKKFELTASHLQTLRSFHRPRLRDDERYLVLLQSGDEVLDYRQAAAYYAHFEVVVEPGGDHRFQQFENHLPRIAEWRAQFRAC